MNRPPETNRPPEDEFRDLLQELRRIELADVDSKDYFRRVVSERVLDLRFLEISLGGAERAVDAPGRDEQPSHSEALADLLGDRADETSGVRMKLAAREDDPVERPAAELPVCLQTVRQDRQREIVEVAHEVMEIWVQRNGRHD